MSFTNIFATMLKALTILKYSYDYDMIRCECVILEFIFKIQILIQSSFTYVLLLVLILLFLIVIPTNLQLLGSQQTQRLLLHFFYKCKHFLVTSDCLHVPNLQFSMPTKTLFFICISSTEDHHQGYCLLLRESTQQCVTIKTKLSQ